MLVIERAKTGNLGLHAVLAVVHAPADVHGPGPANSKALVTATMHARNTRTDFDVRPAIVNWLLLLGSR